MTISNDDGNSAEPEVLKEEASEQKTKGSHVDETKVDLGAVME